MYVKMITMLILQLLMQLKFVLHLPKLLDQLLAKLQVQMTQLAAHHVLQIPLSE